MSDGTIFRKATAQELLDAARRTKIDTYAAPRLLQRAPKNTPLIEFEITACDSPYEEATATVLRMPCGFRIPGIEGCSVTVHDTAGCWLEGPPDPESEDPSPSIGQIGYAVLMQQTGGETGTDECTLDAQDECKWVIISLCKDADEIEITVRNIDPCDSNTLTYSESVSRITFGYGLNASADSGGGARVDLGVTLLGQDIVPPPCNPTGNQQTEVAQYNEIEFLGNLTLNPDPQNACRAVVRGKVVFAVRGAAPTTECDVECGYAVFAWSSISQSWSLQTACVGERCENPPTPTAPPADPSTDQTLDVDCISLPEPITSVCLDTEEIEFSELFNITTPTTGRTLVDIDLCRLFNDDEFKERFCELVDECLEDKAELLCELLEDCIKDKINERLGELCTERAVLVPIDETKAANVNAGETQIEFNCETLRYVACPTGDASTSCGTRIIEGTDCPEDEPAEPTSKAGCSQDAMAMLLEKVQQLEARIAELEAR
jgi:hypothetical protein